MNYFKNFTNPNHDEKEQRKIEFQIDIAESKIDSIERETKEVEERIKRLRTSIDGLL